MTFTRRRYPDRALPRVFSHAKPERHHVRLHRRKAPATVPALELAAALRPHSISVNADPRAARAGCLALSPNAVAYLWAAPTGQGGVVWFDEFRVTHEALAARIVEQFTAFRADLRDHQPPAPCWRAIDGSGYWACFLVQLDDNLTHLAREVDDAFAA